MVKCIVCGKEIEESHYRDEVPVMCGDKCFHINFWNEKVKSYGNGTNGYSKKIAIVNGSHYTFYPDSSETFFQGHGGRQFKIIFNDGRIVQTKNLWHQGDIPLNFRNLLPDNAIFVESDEAIENRRKHKELMSKLRTIRVESKDI